MSRILNLVNLILCMALLLVGAVGYVSFVASKARPINPINYGRVGDVKLSEFAPLDADAALKVLLNKNPEAAVADIEKAVGRHPSSLALYVALLQVKPSIWDAEVARLKTLLSGGTKPHGDTKKGEKDDVAQNNFKLGAILYYKWGQQSTPDEVGIAAGQELIDKAWQELKDPVIGLMLQEAWQHTSRYRREHPYRMDEINYTLIKEVAGEQAYALLQHAKERKWNTTPPPLEIVPVVRLRDLHGVVGKMWSLSAARSGQSVMKDGRSTVVWNARSEEQERQARYFAVWRASIAKVIQSSEN